tara:strand:- start:152 stop:694 length:543 start_codon:yes stop_codon:yes gene_type:complete
MASLMERSRKQAQKNKIKRGLKKVGEPSNKEFIGSGRNKRRNPNYDPRMGTGKKQDFVKNPLKIDMKGMTPARQLSKDELAGRTARSRMMGGKDGPKGPLGGAISKTPYKPKKKAPKPASGKFGQRKAGGKIEKMYGGGMTKKKMMGGGMTVRKMKHGGKAGKCPRDGIAMRGKTRAGRK